ncbi:MAG: hypothetical protein ACR65T_13940 [Methylocystis sp.]|uniref:hypothetical protein n=1 Tax=Methylocystis sp. TaxID=1911079 RepID=UPI003DA4DA9B
MILDTSIVVGCFGDVASAFLHASVSFPSPGKPGVLRGPTEFRQVSCSGTLSGQARPPRPLLWLDLAEGRLRLDRLRRNGGQSTFFP